VGSPRKVAELPKYPWKPGEFGHSPTNHQESGHIMMDLLKADIGGTTFICDKETQKAWFRDASGKVRYQAIKDGKCTKSVSGVQRKTDSRRKADIQERITAIWAMLHEAGVKLHHA
jgi:hypothetical protein